MKQEEKKHREFWLDERIGDNISFTKGTVLGAEIKDASFKVPEWAVHAIEYSAYEQLQAKLEKAKEALELLSEDRYVADFQRALISSRFLARQTLKEIEGE